MLVEVILLVLSVVVYTAISTMNFEWAKYLDSGGEIMAAIALLLVLLVAGLFSLSYIGYFLIATVLGFSVSFWQAALIVFLTRTILIDAKRKEGDEL